MKTVGILGSAREGGNTEILLDIALEEARNLGGSTSKITLRDKVIAECDGCMGCAQTGECVIQDDMQEVYKQIREADGIIWATPVYYWSMSGLTKIALDRTYALNFPTLQQAGKIGGLIVVAGGRGCMSAANPFLMYFIYNHMFSAEFAYAYAREKAEVKKDTIAVAMARTMVRQMHALFQAGLNYPREFDMPLQRLVREKYEP
ncbi:MAG: flavodoxin family protein [Syntrophorhabdales bacterium]|jgi:multimeric flavodoxin WrbA